MWFPFTPVMQQLWNTLLCETVCVCDLNSNHSSRLLTQNSADGKLPRWNEKSDRVQDRFDFTPGPGVGFVLATNRTGAPAFHPALYYLYPPLEAAWQRNCYRLNQKCTRRNVHTTPCKAWCLTGKWIDAADKNRMWNIFVTFIYWWWN